MARDISRRDFIRSALGAAAGTAALGTGACSTDRKSGLGLFDPVAEEDNPYGSIDTGLASYANKYLPMAQSLYNDQRDACLTHSELESTIDEMYQGAQKIAGQMPSAYGKTKNSYGTLLASDRIQPGDSDANGRDDIFDLLHMLKVLSGKENPTSGTDANRDGKYNIFDILELLKILKDPNSDRLGPTIGLYLDDQLLEMPVTLQRNAEGNFNLKVYVDDEKSGVQSYKTTITLEDGQSIEYVNSPEIEIPALDGAYDIVVEAKDMAGNQSTLLRTFSSVPLNSFYGTITETLSRQGISDLEVELTLPDGQKQTASTNSQGVYSFNTPTPQGYSTIKIAGHQDGHEDMYTYENNWVELDKTSSENVQMIKEAEDSDNPGYDLLEHLKWEMGNNVTPGEDNIRWHDDAYPLKVFWDRANAPSDRLVDLLKDGWDLWEEEIGKHLDDMGPFSIFEEVDEMPDMGIYCTWDYGLTAQFVEEEAVPGEYMTLGRLDWDGSGLNRNIDLPGVEPEYYALSAHEFGHAWGFTAHSPKRDHIMYGDAGPLRPTEFEGLTAAVIYRLKSGTILINYSKEN